MDRPDFATPDEDAHEPLQRELALYAFVREEDEREVRLYFRDAPPNEIAASFRRAGAAFITMTGERATMPTVPADRPDDEQAGTEEGQRKRARRSRRKMRRSSPRGEATLRYFYALGEIVYTAIVTAPTGVARSIAPVYPAAAITERELQQRLALVISA